MELLLFVPLGMYCVLLVTKDLEIFQLVLKVPGVVIPLCDQVLELPGSTQKCRQRRLSLPRVAAAFQHFAGNCLARLTSS